jgi:hypothetical protein
MGKDEPTFASVRRDPGASIPYIFRTKRAVVVELKLNY